MAPEPGPPTLSGSPVGGWDGGGQRKAAEMTYDDAVIVAVDDGEPDPTVLRWAADEAASRHCRSVSQQVLRHARCPVLVVH